MRRLLIVLLFTTFGIAAAQDVPLSTGEVTVVTETDLYGQAVLYAQGTLTNDDTQAYANVSLQATAYNARGTVVGEGFGYLVNACGAGLPLDFSLQPGAAQPFSIPLEVDEGAQVDRVDVTATGEAVDPQTVDEAELPPGISRVVGGEVVQLEWIDGESLRYGVGCFRNLFTELTWYELKVGAEPQAAVHPKAELVTEVLLRQLGLLDPQYFQHSFLSYAPNYRRLVYQNELNTVLSAEPDGSFKRVVFDTLSDRTLQGITWLNEGRFLAYYYGAYGDPVTYFTAHSEGQTLSEPARNSIPSFITPGASPDGQDIIIAAEIDGTLGYYRKRAAYPTTELLFEAQPPGNNWPGPLYEQDADGADFVYVALPTDDGAALTCFNLETQERHDLTLLPLKLSNEDRAWWSLAPDASTIALYASGLDGGLWLIDLDTVRACS